MEGPAQVLISTIDYNDYVGRIGVGRISRGTLQARAMMVVRCQLSGAGIRPRRRGV